MRDLTTRGAAAAVIGTTALCVMSVLWGEEVRPAREWKGEVSDKGLESQKPKAGVIADRETFAKLWAKWRPNEPVPAVDFARDFVAVATGEDGTDRVALEGDGKGNYRGL